MRHHTYCRFSRYRAGLVGLPLFVATFACTAEVATVEATEVEVTTAAVNGEEPEIDDSCTPTEAEQVRLALGMLRDMLTDGTLLDCLKAGVFSGYHPQHPVHWNDPNRVPLYPEHVVRSLLPETPSVSCINGGESHFSYPEAAQVARNFDLFAPSLAQTTAYQMGKLTGTIAHEFVHSHGYSDGPEDGKNNPEGWFIVAEQVARCAHSLVDPVQPNRPNGARHDYEMAQTRETVLSAVGAVFGGAPIPQMQCSQTEFATGFSGRASDEIHALGLNCPSVWHQPQGGSDGTAFTRGCSTAFGEVLVGIHGRADGLVQSIGPICGYLSDVQAGLRSEFGDDPGVGGGPEENGFRRLCPIGHAVKGIRIRVGARVDRIELVCQKASSPRSINLHQLSRLGGPGGSLTHLETCPSRSAMHKLVTTYDDSSGGVGRLSGACKVVSNSTQNGQITLSPPDACVEQPDNQGCNGRHFVAGVGAIARGEQFDWAEDDCSGLFIGMRVTTDSWIRNLQGVCLSASDAVKWSAGNSSVSPTFTPVRGRPSALGGTATTATCPFGLFMVGFKGTSGDWLDSLEIACRRF